MWFPLQTPALDLGPQVALAAPGGNCVNTTVGEPCLYSMITTANAGTTTPTQNDYTTDIINDPSLGTSFSAPIASSRDMGVALVTGEHLLVKPRSRRSGS